MKRLTGPIQPYAWGSPTAIPEFLGTEPTGDPQAELWLGAHPSAPATVDGVTGEGAPLDTVIDSDPSGWVGSAPIEAFGPRLPYLMKVLAAAQPLSLQAHPDRAQAERGFAREEDAGVARDAPERTYKDDWPKPEALCALGEVHALCGFREPSQTYALFEALGVGAAVDLVQPLRSGGAAELEQVFGALLRMSDAAPLVGQVITAGKEHVHDQGELGDFARTACEVGAFYPGDPGVLAALIMNRVVLQRYDALYLPAGNLHAYLRGIGVEIMANSDNVLRGGLTGKHIDVEELLRLLDFTPGWAGPVPVIEESPGRHRYQTPAPEFALWRVDGEHNGTLPADGQGRIVLTVDGTLTLHGDSEIALTRGQAAFVRPDDSPTVSGPGVAFVGAAGTDG